MSSFGPHLKIIGICYHLNMLKQKKKRNKYTTHKIFMKQIVYQSKHQLQHKFNRDINFWYSKNCMGPLNEENKLPVLEKNKKNWKIFENI